MMQKLERFGAVLSAVGPIVGVLVLFAIAIGVPTLIGLVVLGPINRAAGRLRAPTRFQLSDFLWLLVQVQLALAYCVEFVGVKHLWFFTLVLGFLLTAVTAMWAGGVSFMSRAGVTHPPRRAVFVLFLLPITLALMMTATLLLVAAVVTSTGVSFSLEYRVQIEYGIERLNLGPISAGIGMSLLPVLGYGLRRLSRWVVLGPTSANDLGSAALAKLLAPHPLDAVTMGSSSDA
ncbi:MAG: hypothetical protein U0939_10045 [Pirellulales bacterium]